MFVSRVQSAAGNYVRPLAKKTANKLTSGKQFNEITFNDLFKKSICEPEDMTSINKTNKRKAGTGQTYEAGGCGLDSFSCGLC